MVYLYLDIHSYLISMAGYRVIPDTYSNPIATIINTNFTLKISCIVGSRRKAVTTLLYRMKCVYV